MAKHTFTTVAIATLLALPLGACQTPLNTRGVDTQLAGRCKLMAYGEDRPHFAIGLLSTAIVQANVDARRQEIYDSCVAAEGGRERPAEMP
jgi:hypothetical protein